MISSHSGLDGLGFSKVPAVKISSQKRLKTPQCFLSLFMSFIEVQASGRFRLWRIISYKKNLRRHMVSSFCLSVRYKCLKGSGCAFFICVPFRRRLLLEGSGCGDEPWFSCFFASHIFCLSCRCGFLGGPSHEEQPTEKRLECHVVFFFLLCFWTFWLRSSTHKKTWNATFFFLFFASHSGVGFWKVLAVVSFFASHSGVGFCKILAVKITSHKKKFKTPLKFTVLKPQTRPTQVCPTIFAQCW